MRTRFILALAIAAVVITATVALAAPAANDDIADAIALTEGVEQRFSTIDATIEATEDVCDGDNTVWFTFTAATAGEYVAYATGSDHDTEIGWNDTVDNSTGACNDDAADSYDAVEEQRTFAPAEQEFVQMGVNSTDDVGTGGVGVTAVVAAADDFASATDLTFRSGATTAVIGLEFAGTEATEAGESVVCGLETLDAESAWLNFVAPESGSWMFESKSTESTDIAVYSGSSVGALSLLDCATVNRIAVVADLEAGSTYRIRIGLITTSEPVVVRAEPAPIPMTATLVDADGDGTSTDVGNFSDLAVVDGEPAVAYYDPTNQELRYATRSGGVWADTLVDADGDGTSTNVGRSLSIAILASGEPAVAYYDSTNQELRYATRSGGVWADTLVDADGDGTSTDVGGQPSLLVLASGEPAVAYYDSTNLELRFATRSGGVWTDALVDADGDGTSTSVGRHPGLVQFANGDLGVSYVDATNAQIRFARMTGGTWSDETVYTDADGNVPIGAGTVVDSVGNPVVAATDIGQGNHVLGWWNGTSWDIEWDNADRKLGELDFECSRPELLIDGGDTLFIPWTDCNLSGSIAMSTRDTNGNWRVYDIVAQVLDPTGPDYAGTRAVWTTREFGAAWLPDGRMAVTFQNDSDSTLWYAQDALKADAGPDAGSQTVANAVFDGSASSDAWGSIAKYAWSGAPAGCTVSGADSATPSVSCSEATTGDLTLTVTDTDGFTHSDTAGFEVAACDLSADPFTDVPASSFARDDVTCIYNLGVTTGTSLTTFSPGDNVTREQMAAFLSRLYKSMTGGDAPIVATPFTDVPAASFASDDIARIFGLGITTGTSSTTYSPGDDVSREQMAAFLSRLYKAATGSDAPIVATPFTDVPAASFASDDIARIFGLGITTGTSSTTFSPGDEVTRIQMAAFLARLFLAG